MVSANSNLSWSQSHRVSVPLTFGSLTRKGLRGGRKLASIPYLTGHDATARTGNSGIARESGLAITIAGVQWGFSYLARLQPEDRIKHEAEEGETQPVSSLLPKRRATSTFTRLRGMI